MNWSSIKNQAVSFIAEAANRLRDSASKTLQINTKAHANDLVTNQDIETQRFLTEKILAFYPDHEVIGEEGQKNYEVPAFDRITWIIDPIDGTSNFVHQNFNFAISIGIYENGSGRVGVVYDVERDEWFTAVKGKGAFMNGNRLPHRETVPFEESFVGMNPRWLVKGDNKEICAEIVKKARGVRAYGAASLEIAYVAAGRLDAYVNLRLSPWDYAGAAVLIAEAGAECSTLQGSPLAIGDRKTSFVAAEPHMHEEILRLFSQK